MPYPSDRAFQDAPADSSAPQPGIGARFGKGEAMDTPGGSESERPGLKKATKAAVFWLLRYTGAAFIARHTVQNRRVTILAYHDPDPGTFERHLALLKSLYSVIPLETFLTARAEGDLRGLPRRSLIITLDDGWAGNARLLPALKRHGVRPTVFLCTSIVGTKRHYWWTHAPDPADREILKQTAEDDRLGALASSGFASDTEYADRQALSAEDLAGMAPWVDFQSHTRSHPILPCCSDERAASEIADSAEDIARLTGVRPRAFAYPDGAHCDRDVELVRQAGYECAITIVPGYNDARTDHYRLKRIIITDGAGPTELVARASGTFGILLGSMHRLFG
jgi:peptidoglycan/xylan/chitin deacetylase (PgdA/CDA1 family)